MGRDYEVKLENHQEMRGLLIPEDMSSKLQDPFVPRANYAPSIEAPDGSTQHNWVGRHRDQTVLEQHIAFFDKDGDGVIWPSDTFFGFKELGYNLFIQLFAAFVIHFGMSYATLNSWVPDPFFRIYVKNINHAKHGSDTGTYDKYGRFMPDKFEAIFKYDREGKGGVTWWDGMRMVRSNRLLADPFGWTAAFLEFTAAYILVWPKDGIVTREAFRRTYDGSLFFEVAEAEKKRPHTPLSGLSTENVPGRTID
jgi:hypothetical protein